MQLAQTTVAVSTRLMGKNANKVRKSEDAMGWCSSKEGWTYFELARNAPLTQMKISNDFCDGQQRGSSGP